MPTPTDAGERHQPVGSHELDQVGEDLLTADEARGRHRQVAAVGVVRARRRELRRGAGDDDLEQALGPRQVGQPVIAQVDQLRTVEQCRRTRADEDLSPVCRRHDACGAVRHGAEVAPASLAGRAGLESHPCSQPQVTGPGLGGEGALRCDRGIDRVLGILEHRSETVAVRGEHAPAVVGESVAQQRVVPGQDRFHLGGVVLPQHRRALDAGEQERRLVGRCARNHALRMSSMPAGHGALDQTTRPGTRSRQ